MLITWDELSQALFEAGLPKDPYSYTDSDWQKYDEIEASLEKAAIKRFRTPGDLFFELAKTDLPKDPSEYTNSDWEAYDRIDAELERKAAEKAAEANIRTDGYYIISTTIYEVDGCSEISTDVRDLSLDQLKGVCEELPRFTRYFFERVRQEANPSRD